MTKFFYGLENLYIIKIRKRLKVRLNPYTAIHVTIESPYSTLCSEPLLHALSLPLLSHYDRFRCAEYGDLRIYLIIYDRHGIGYIILNTYIMFKG